MRSQLAVMWNWNGMELYQRGIYGIPQMTMSLTSECENWAAILL
jgi:hypothetical protein